MYVQAYFFHFHSGVGGGGWGIGVNTISGGDEMDNN